METTVYTPEDILSMSFSTGLPHNYQVETNDGQAFHGPFDINLKTSRDRFEVEVQLDSAFRAQQPAIAYKIEEAVIKAVLSQMTRQAGIGFDFKVNLGASAEIQELLNNI